MAINGQLRASINRLAASAKRAEKAAERGRLRGLKMAGLFIQRESQKIVPVDTGLLRNTANTRMEGGDVIVSYGTEYAIFVHEDLEARHKPGKFAKFLELPMVEHRDRVVAIVAREIKKEVGA